MILEHIGLNQINGPLIVLEGVENAHYEEMVDIHLDNGTKRVGRVVQIEGDKVVIQVFEGTTGLSLANTASRMTGHAMELPLSPEILGRVFDGLGRPIDGLGDIYPEKKADVNGQPINPVARVYPRNYINTGISSIDCLATLIRGQKLPIFSGSGMKHNELAVQIVKQAKVADGGDFAVVFAAMGVKNDVAEYFRKSFEEANVMNKVVMFLNHSNDPIIERIITPRCALTAAEYLAYELGMDILVILTDMTSYAEAVREFSSSKGEIPGRKGFPGYLYSDFASLYETLSRRYAHAAREKEEGTAKGKFTDLPDLILIDGGPQQLRFARQAILDLGIEPPAMFGLAERLEEIWLPDAAEPILLDHHTPELQLVQRVRNEAHRFGIIHHRTLRGKASIHSQLEDIPGVGPARRKALLKAFGSLKAIREADMDALTAVPGMNRTAAEAVRAWAEK